MINNTIRIGTRDSELALWQAHTVEKKLNNLGYSTQIVPIKTQGDILLTKPLYELGITGIFTKTLDIAMINGDIDIAVHSMKDVPTVLPQGIIQAAVLERASVLDILVYKNSLDFLDSFGIVATGSLRRQAQWLNKYPSHSVVDLRGNINKRMQKLEENSWNGAVFAAAGLERINLKPVKHISLDWMIPAPAQGAMMIVAMEKDSFSLEALSQLNHIETEICTHIERQFLKILEGGCTAPIGAFAKYNEKDNTIIFRGALFSLDGQEKIYREKIVDIEKWKKLGYETAKEIIQDGGSVLMQNIKKTLKK